jgi:dihydropyrimidinase
MDCVVKNGTVVTAEEIVDADIGIQGDRVVAIASGLQSDKVIDAKGHYVFPGFVDAHVHLQLKIGDIASADDFLPRVPLQLPVEAQPR